MFKIESEVWTTGGTYAEASIRSSEYKQILSVYLVSRCPDANHPPLRILYAGPREGVTRVSPEQYDRDCGLLAWFRDAEGSGCRVKVAEGFARWLRGRWVKEFGTKEAHLMHVIMVDETSDDRKPLFHKGIPFFSYRALYDEVMFRQGGDYEDAMAEYENAVSRGH